MGVILGGGGNSQRHKAKEKIREGEGKMSFSFVEHTVGPQSLEQTLRIMTYELGHLIEYDHKARCYGATGYNCDGNQQKEMSDLISMTRYYCEQKGWSYEKLKALGEEAYNDRMEDLRKHGCKG